MTGPIEALRRAVARRLHYRDRHLLCRRSVRTIQPLLPVAMILDDGTYWQPDINGFAGPTTVEWHR